MFIDRILFQERILRLDAEYGRIDGIRQILHEFYKMGLAPSSMGTQIGVGFDGMGAAR